MKKNTKPTDRKRTFAICGLSALCVAVLAGAWFLTREPETEFICTQAGMTTASRPLSSPAFFRSRKEAGNRNSQIQWQNKKEKR